MIVRKILEKLNNSIGGGAILIAFFSIISKLIGLYRDRLLASEFGASRFTDIYFASFKIPDLIFNILVLGALMVSFIPIFQKVYGQDKKAGILLSNSVLNILLLTITGLSILVYILTPTIIPYLVPGFNQIDQALTASMTRIVLISVVLFTVSNVISGVLNSWKKFLSFSISPVLYNVGIITGIIFFYPLFGLEGLAWGVVLGSLLHLVVQLIEAVRNGWFYKFRLIVDKQVKRIFILMIPRTIGLAASQLNIVVITLLASLLPAGSLAIYNYANNLQSFPVSVFGISLAIAAFPSFSRVISNDNQDEFRRLFSLQIRRILYFLIPISLTILLLRAQIIRVVLGAGFFDWEATRLTAQTLGYFALSLTSQGLIPLLARSFYALEDTKTPVVIGIFSMIINIILSFILVKPFGVIGLALAFSLASIINMIILFLYLHKRFGDLNDKSLIRSISRILSISILSGAFIYLSLQITAEIFNTRTFMGIFLQGLISGSIGIILYIWLSFIMKFDEVQIIRSYLSKLINPFKNARKQQ